MIRFDENTKTVTLSVRDLVAEGARSGHLYAGGFSSGALRLAVGREIHQAWAAKRTKIDPTYSAEVPIKIQIVVEDWTVVIEGRMDGVSRIDGNLVVEEVKSTTLDNKVIEHCTADDWPDYKLQLELYLWMLKRSGEQTPRGYLVLRPIGTEDAIDLPVSLSEASIEERARRWMSRVITHHTTNSVWREARRNHTFTWPWPHYRKGQLEIVESVRAGLLAKEPILIEAPTGLGKSVAAITATLEYARLYNKSVFWATARNTAATVVKETVQQLNDAGFKIRATFLSSRESICPNESVKCHPEHCTMAQDYFDKRDAGHAILKLRSQVLADAETALPISEANTICPYQLLTDTTDAIDLMVGDYNYLFDPNVTLKRHFVDSSNQWVVVVDECHQMVNRVRSALSPSITEQAIIQAKDSLAGGEPYVELVDALNDLLVNPDLQDEFDQDGLALTTLPTEALSGLLARFEEASLMGHPPKEALRDLVVSLHRFVDQLGPTYTAVQQVGVACGTPGQRSLKIIALDPSSWIGARISSLAGFVGLSATIQPVPFYTTMFGLDRTTIRQLSVESPFPAQNLQVVITPSLSTLYRDRASQVAPTAEMITKIITATKGNCVIYFSSFSLLNAISSKLHMTGRVKLTQRPRMSEAARKRTLNRLTIKNQPAVLLAVVGGIFAEGIDLPPGALSTVVIIGPSLPPIGLERSMLRSHYQENYGDGFTYASVVPGMTKVVQAAGRLIRREEDKGVIVLIGHRFMESTYSNSFPSWWRPLVSNDPDKIVARFFEATDD